MKSVNTCLPELVKKLHFNKDHPENHNIKDGDIVEIDWNKKEDSLSLKIKEKTST